MNFYGKLTLLIALFLSLVITTHYIPYYAQLSQTYTDGVTSEGFPLPVKYHGGCMMSPEGCGGFSFLGLGINVLLLGIPFFWFSVNHSTSYLSRFKRRYTWWYWTVQGFMFLFSGILLLVLITMIIS